MLQALPFTDHQTRAAKQLGMSRTTFVIKLRLYRGNPAEV